MKMFKKQNKMLQENSTCHVETDEIESPDFGKRINSNWVK